MADCGPYPTDPRPAIQGWMNNHLLDPFSAVIMNTTKPERGAVTRGLIQGGGYLYGWKTFVTINARNAYGGYTGARQYYMLIREDVVRVAEESPDGSLPFMCH